MASENNKMLQQALAPALKRLGFKKSGATWRKGCSNAIVVLNIQGSQWGPTFYINLGIYFRELGELIEPNECVCHVRTRLTELVPDRNRLNELLDFGKSIQEGDRLQEIEALVTEYGLSWLATVSTIKGARIYCDSQSPKSPWITKEYREHLAVPTDA
jgi:hypothetical protein